MALPSSGTIDLELIYAEAVAGGYSGAKDMSFLWGRLGTDSGCYYRIITYDEWLEEITAVSDEVVLSSEAADHVDAILLNSTHSLIVWTGSNNSGLCQIINHPV